MATTAATRAGAPPKLPGLLMGLGLGGFVDGIVLHQLLQWHHMLTSTAGNPPDTMAGRDAHTVADGLFHSGTWLVVAEGILLAVHSWQRGAPAHPWRTQFGLVLAGWGAFNLVEGLVDHVLLGIHHVRDDLGGPAGWDIGFLVLGAVLLLGGLALARAGERRAASRG